MYGFDYQKVDDLYSLENSLNDFFAKDSQPSLLEIKTPEKLNDKILLDYFKNLK